MTTTSTGISTELLAPIVALNIWTFGMEVWMYSTRIPAVRKYGADMRSEATKAGKLHSLLIIIFLSSSYLLNSPSKSTLDSQNTLLTFSLLTRPPTTNSIPKHNDIRRYIHTPPIHDPPSTHPTSNSTRLTKPQEFNAKIPAPVRWKADNYNHLLEQPTQFYAIALTLALLGKYFFPPSLLASLNSF
jgi:hypothetical protein